MLTGTIENAATTRSRAIVLLVLSAVFWSLGGILIKWIRWNPMAISGMRGAIGAVLIWIAFRRMRFTWSFAQIGGAVAFASTVTLYVVANKMTTAANAILLQYTAPVFVALFGGWFLGERATRLDWIVVFTVMTGMVFFFLDRLTVTGVLGNVAGLLSGVSFGWLTLFLRKQKDGSPLESIFLGNVLAAVIGFPFMLRSFPDAGSWGSLALLGCVQFALPYILYSIAVRRVSALEAIIVPMIEPVLNPIWVLLLVGEVPGPMAIVGGVLILGSIFARAALPSLRKRPYADPAPP